MQEINQIKVILKDMHLIVRAMKNRQLDLDGIQDVEMSVDEINFVLFHSKKLKFQKDYNLKMEEEYLDYIGEIEALIRIWEKTIIKRNGSIIDREFGEIYDFFKYVDLETICHTIIGHFMDLSEGQRIEFLSLPYRYTFLQHKINFVRGDFSLIEMSVKIMSERIEDYKWLYKYLADNRSRMVLNGIIRYWFEFDVEKLNSLAEEVFLDYYDLDILECKEDGVMVNLGAGTGDAVLSYINTYDKTQKIFAYESQNDSYKNLLQRISDYPNVLPVQDGGNHLDVDIKENISVIRIELGGAEKDAILGAKNHIKSEKPQMLISVYHSLEDIFDIPLLISSIRNDYKFYLRFAGHKCIWPCSYMLFAV